MTTVTHAQVRTAAPRTFALHNVLLVVEWGSSPVNLIHWTLALADPSTRISVMCTLDSQRAAPTLPSAGPQQTIHVKWRPGRNRLVNETCAQLRAGGLQAEPIYRDGAPEDAVQWAADASEADLVIANAAFADRFHGKPLARIKHAARTSFLFVRSSPRKASILLADDFTPASREARMFSSWAADRLAVPLRITSERHEVPPPDPQVAFSTKRQPATPLLRSEFLGTQTPAIAVADQILLQAATQDAQLIIVGNSRRGSVRRLLFGSVSDEVSRHARTNVLVATPETD